MKLVFLSRISRYFISGYNNVLMFDLRTKIGSLGDVHASSHKTTCSFDRKSSLINASNNQPSGARLA